MGKTARLQPSFRPAPASLVTLFNKIIGAFPAAETRKMFGYPAAFIKGQMFGGIHNESLILKLSPADLKTFLALEGTHPFEPMPGRPMREYVVVPPSVLNSEAELSIWFGRAFEYVGSLPPKPPKKPNKKI